MGLIEKIGWEAWTRTRIIRSRVWQESSMMLIRLAFSCVAVYGFSGYSAAIVPKLFPFTWGEPLSWHKFLGHSFRFRKSVFVSPSRERGLGKGTAFESPSPPSL